MTGQASPLDIGDANESGGLSWSIKVSVVVDGTWLADAYDGKADFLINPYQ
jgi:hypothetical protein